MRYLQKLLRKQVAKSTREAKWTGSLSYAQPMDEGTRSPASVPAPRSGARPQIYGSEVRQFPEEYEPWRINYYGHGYLIAMVLVGCYGKFMSVLLLRDVLLEC